MPRDSANTATPVRGTARHHESSDDYDCVVVRLCQRHRVIACKDDLQWILQRIEGERHGRARWAAAGYFRTRMALIRASRALCARIDPTALAALERLPDQFRSAGR